MLVDFIGIAAAIAAMMLLLSLIVSALSELTQAIFRVRGRNLQYGLACALAVEGNKPDRTNRLEAMEILNRTDAALLTGRFEPGSLRSKFLGPPVSWLEHADLVASLKGIATAINSVVKPAIDEETIGNAIQDVAQHFESAERALRSRFALIMRGVSFAWSVALAAVFQINVLDLVRQLSSGDTQIDITPLQQTLQGASDGDGIAHVIGILATALLIALGAPFWHRALTGLVFARQSAKVQLQ